MPHETRGCRQGSGPRKIGSLGLLLEAPPAGLKELSDAWHWKSPLASCMIAPGICKHLSVRACGAGTAAAYRARAASFLARGWGRGDENYDKAKGLVQRQSLLRHIQKSLACEYCNDDWATAALWKKTPLSAATLGDIQALAHSIGQQY